MRSASPTTSRYGLSSYVWTENLGGAPRRGRDRGRHVLRQQPERARPAPAFRRHQGIGHRARRRHLELRGLPRAEERRVSLGSHPFRAGAPRRGDGQARARSQDHARTVDVPAELAGPHFGCREAAIDGHRAIGRRCRALGVDTIVVFDVHWLVNAGYHVNCDQRFEGIYTSNELPHFIATWPMPIRATRRSGADRGNATARGVFTRAHDATRWSSSTDAGPDALHERGPAFQSGLDAGWCMWHQLDDSGRFGTALREAIERATTTRRGPRQRFAVAPVRDNGSRGESIHQISRDSSGRSICMWWICGSAAT